LIGDQVSDHRPTQLVLWIRSGQEQAAILIEKMVGSGAVCDGLKIRRICVFHTRKRTLTRHATARLAKGAQGCDQPQSCQPGLMPVRPGSTYQKLLAICSAIPAAEASCAACSVVFHRVVPL